MKKLLMLPFKILSYVVGSFSWTAPIWLSSIFKLLKVKPKITAAFFSLFIAGYISYLYFDSLPKPVMVKALIENIRVTPTYEGASQSNLNIQFEYDLSVLNSNQEQPVGLPSVARIDLVGQKIEQGITLSPAKKGKWTWVSDKHLQFVPETDWPAGTEYTIKFEKNIFVNEAILSSYKYQTTTPIMTARFSSIEFYQDPIDTSIRQVVSTLKFSHPVDKSSLEERLSMGMRVSGKSISDTVKPYTYKLNYSKNSREAYIISEAISLPNKPNYMTVKLEKGVSSLLGGEGTRERAESKVAIPDIYSFLKVSNSHIQIVRNEKNEPEQVLILEFTDEINQKELLSKLSLYQLPNTKATYGKKYWRSPREVNNNTLLYSEKIKYRLIPNEKEYSKVYNFVLDLPENRFVYVKVAKGLESVNKFIQSSFYDSVIHLPRYPKEIKITGEGSILTHTGNHKLSVLTRGIPSLKYTIGRLLKGQLYHLISQTSGDITNPSFNNWNFDMKNVSELETKVVKLRQTHAKTANYSSLDLSEYLPKQKNRFGMFFVKVTGWNSDTNRRIYSVNDSRVILVTDLGVIVKNNADQSHDVFIQSIASGEPVFNAKVELLGKNGIALYESKTDSNGHVSFPSTKGLHGEKTPTVYIVKTANDISFIPYNRSSRQINLSRFDIGGVRSNKFNKETLNAFMFSDRGIYRPGEKINLGMIVKNFDLSNVEDIPLELVIRGPRNNEVKVSKFKLPENGFTDFQYPTESTSETGNYSASLHLVRDNKYRSPSIGDASFKVEEFQPDTMKIQSKLVDVVKKGWNTQSNIVSSVELKNLFGTPAQDRKLIGRVIIEPYDFKFNQYKEYTFTNYFLDKDKKPLRLNKTLGEKRTNEDGEAQFDINLDKFRAGSYKLQFIAEGFDQAGGRSVVASNSALISPLKFIVGYKADGNLDYINAGSERKINFISLNHTLKTTDSNDLLLKLIKIQHVSTLVKQKNGTYNYQSIAKESEISSKAINIYSRGFNYNIDTTVPGDYAVEIRDKDNKKLSRLSYSVVGFANLTGKIDKSAELSLKLNKKDYFPGDEIEMSIKAPYSGSGLITIETDKVHQYKWFKASAESTMQSIYLPSHLEGTAYINVAFVRDVSSKEIYTSPLSYAVQPFSIDKSKRKVNISLKTKDIVRPGKPMEIEFNTSKPSKIAIFAVDEGILQVAKYKTPDPLSYYLKKRSLDVQTMQILDLLLPDFNLVKALSSSGGGSGLRQKALAKNLNPFSRKTDAPAVYWSGIYDANNDISKVTFDVPNTFAGELRIMAVAVGEESVGATSTSSIVRGAFVISPNVLTQAAPGDEFLVTVGVTNIIDGSGKDADIKLDISSSKHIEVVGKKLVPLIISEGSEARYQFKVKAKAYLGAAELKFTARYKNEVSIRTAGLSIRPATPYETSLISGFNNEGQLSLNYPRSLYSNLGKQSIAASVSPLVIVDGLVNYLDNYPHGCTEQIVSKVFPLVGLLTHPSYAAHLPKVNEQFSYLIDKLRERQLADGGFVFWPGHRTAADYPSIYIMHFLLEANQQGYAVPSDMLSRGKQYLLSYAAKPSTTLSSARNRANSIYILSRMGEITTNYLVDLEEELKRNHKDDWKEDITSSYMAATYKLLQKDDKASDLIDGYKLNNEKILDADDFHSMLAVDAQYIYLLSKHFGNRAKDIDGNQILMLTDKIFKGQYNTISSAYSILALGAYSKLVIDNEIDENIVFSTKDNKNTVVELKAALQPFMHATIPVEFKSVNVTADKSLYYINSQSGFNTNVTADSIRDGLEVYRDFLDSEGNIVTTYEQGKELTVRIKIRALNNKSLSNIAIVDLLPGGFEVIRSSVSRTAYNWRADYIDIREDRVVYYGNIDSSIKELSYKVKLTSAGDFIIPPTTASSMYDRSIKASSVSGKFKVISSQ